MFCGSNMEQLKGILMKNFMAIDQYGETFHALGKYPRKELMNRLASSHAAKMYIDDAQGNATHCGYVIKGHWLTLYEVKPYQGRA